MAAGNVETTTPATEPTVSEPATEPTPVEPAVAVATAETPRPARRSGVPVWLFLMSVIVSAVVVGAAVYFVAGKKDNNDSAAAAGIVDGLMRLGQQDQANIKSYAGQLPPDFTTEFPMYAGADIVVSVAIPSDQGTGYLIVMSTPDPASDVYTYYSQALDKDPWQVEIGRSSDEFTGLRFLRPDNIDITGDVSLHRSTLDDRTVIYLSYTDASQSILPGGSTDPFTLGVSRPLACGLPG